MLLRSRRTLGRQQCRLPPEYRWGEAVERHAARTMVARLVERPARVPGQRGAQPPRMYYKSQCFGSEESMGRIAALQKQLVIPGQPQGESVLITAINIRVPRLNFIQEQRLNASTSLAEFTMASS